MDFSPDKFFIGLMDFFSIILPGALLTYFAQDLAGPYLLGATNYNSLSETKGILIFLFSSYMSGHFIFALGSLLDEFVYDIIRKATFKEQVRKLIKKNDLSPAWARFLAIRFFKREIDNTVDLAVAIKNQHLDPIQASSSINAFQWCKAQLILNHPTAIAGVNKFEADSKFFRSFSVVLVFIMIWSIATGEYALALICLFTMLLSCWRYIDQRAKAVSQAYWYIITLEGNNKNADIKPPSRKGSSHAGGIVFRKKKNAIQYLMVESTKGEEWVFPKGHIEQGETEQEAAIREVKEEAGVWAIICKDLGEISFTSSNAIVQTQFYLMKSIKDGKPIGEDKNRKHKWAKFEEVYDNLSFPDIKGLLVAANKLVLVDPNLTKDVK